MVQVKLKKFDLWLDYRTVIHFGQIKTMKKLESLLKLENHILDWTKTNLSFEALERRKFLAMIMCESKLQIVLNKKKEKGHFNPHSPTSRDDVSVISQL